MNFFNYILYYLVIIPISILPFPLLYLLSDFVYIILYQIAGYRTEVVRKNLKNSFPEKSDRELKEIEIKFYHHLCDLLLETFKTFTISKREIEQRIKYVNPDIINDYHKKGISVIGVTAHYGNWEWGALSMSLNVHHKTMGIFRTLSSPFWDKTMRNSRERFGLDLVSTEKVKQWFQDHKNVPVFPGFVGDQMPSNKWKCHWMNFLNQDTSVFLGAEKYARELNFPIVFGVMKKVKRGYYEIEFTLITEDPSKETPTFITETHVKLLENIIIEQPEYWLWTHKRWKNARPDDYQPFTGE